MEVKKEEAKKIGTILPKLFVAGIPEEVADDKLRGHFEALETSIKVKSVSIFRDRTSSRSKGLAILEFYSIEDSKTTSFFLLNIFFR